MSSYIRPNSYALQEALLSRRNFLKAAAAAAAAPAITGGFGFFSHASGENRYGVYHNSHGIRDENADPHQGHEHLPGQNHWAMGADGRAWQTGCGYGV